MKNKNKVLIATAAAAAGAALFIYMMRKRKVTKQSPEAIPSRKSHHLTDVFSHAKNYDAQL